MRYPLIVIENLGYFNKWRLFGNPPYDCTPNTKYSRKLSANNLTFPNVAQFLL